MNWELLVDFTFPLSLSGRKYKEPGCGYGSEIRINSLFSSTQLKLAPW